MHGRNLTLNFLFKFSAVLKVLFLLNMFLIEQYKSYLIKNENKSNLFESLNLDLNIEIHIPWYTYLFGIVVLTGFFVNLIIVNIYAFKPCSGFSRFVNRQTLSKLVYIIEANLLIGAVVVGYPELQDAFASRDYGIFAEVVDRLFNTEDSDKLRLVNKLNALNFIIPAISSLIVLSIFWQVRKMNIAKCLETVDQPQLSS
jgi:hypothetical protein